VIGTGAAGADVSVGHRPESFDVIDKFAVPIVQQGCVYDVGTSARRGWL
jgi:hypothetical protein